LFVPGCSAAPGLSRRPAAEPIFSSMAGSRIKTVAARLSREEPGLTLIELLVVLIIIGILAAIVIAAFATQQNKAHDADAKVHARSAQTAMESYFLEHKSYAGATTADLEEEQTALKD